MLINALRAEEVQAWKRLVRVIGHELNNYLTVAYSHLQLMEIGAEEVPEGIQKRMDVIVNPTADRARSALSRPDPGP